MEDNGAGTFDDWRRALVSSPSRLVSEEFALNTEKVGNYVVSSDRKVEYGGGVCDENGPVEASSECKLSGARMGGSIAERRAAKCGFNASRINVARFRSTSPLSSPAARSPYLTIPPGISPAALLDSPIMLPNSQAQPSPTTGTFPFPSLNHESLILNSVTPATDGDRDGDVGSFSFKPQWGAVSLPCISGLGNQPPIDFEFPAEFPNNCATDSPAEVEVLKNMNINAKSAALQSCHTDTAGSQLPPLREPIDGVDSGARHVMEGHQKGIFPPTGMVRTTEDGYNWRKYGQKQVKGSEYPRSYYKCTHPNCQVKKKVERSHDGQITEIIYKGAHNHPNPQPSRRTILGSPFSFNEMSEIGEGNGSCVKLEGGAIWKNIQLGCKDIKVGSDWRADGLERTSSASVVTEISDPLSTAQGKSMGMIESVGTPELSSTLASHDGDDEDGATQGSISPGDDADDDESELKRRKKESCLMTTNFASRAMREPRVVVQIESEVDILDDGYRWRKYGQKVVKGNPNPRSYYKCTSAGCSVRKHVERASHNLNSVITTYEGKHNHEVPAAKNSSHMNSCMGNLPLAASNTHPNLTLPRTANVSKPEAQVPDLALPFKRKPALGNEFMRPNLLGNFCSDTKFGASSIYQMRFPPLQNPMPYGSFVMSPNHNETHPTCSVAPVVPDFPMSIPMSIPRPANMAMGRFDSNNYGKPSGPVQSFLGGQQRENDVRVLKPKQEQDDNLYDTPLPIVDHENASLSLSSSVFCRIIGNFPN